MQLLYIYLLTVRVSYLCTSMITAASKHSADYLIILAYILSAVL